MMYSQFIKKINKKVFKYWYYKKSMIVFVNKLLLPGCWEIIFKSIGVLYTREYVNNQSDLVVFQVDIHHEENINIAYAQINQFNHFQVTCLKIKVENNPQLNINIHSTSIESFWTKTYESNAHLPKRLFLMKDFKKLIQYFKDQKQRIIQTEEKIKNDKRKLLMNLWVPVTKNITDFVPLQLEYIEPDMINYFFQAQKTAFDLIHQKILQILQQKRAKKILQDIQQRKNSQQKMRESQYQCTDNLQEGQISQQILYGEENLQSQFEDEIWPIQVYDDDQKQKDYSSQQCFPLKNDYKSEDIQNKTYFQQSPQSKHLLKQQYIESLEQKNEILLDRVLNLQQQLVKKNILLQTYEDPFSDFDKIQEIIQKKCQTRVERSYKAINSLMVMFHDLKKCITSESEVQQKSKDGTEYQQQQGQITPKKDINKIISQISGIFQQFY